jgi:hypothetical protein
METDQTKQAMKRIQEIKVSLEKIEQDEQEELKALDTNRPDIKVQQLMVENLYLRTRVELYNEKAQIESALVHSEAREPEDIDKEELVRMAQEVDLAKALRDREFSPAKGVRSCWTNCVECITSCTECVTSCTECIASPGGSCAITSLVSSPCVPKPDIGEQDWK